MITCVRTYLRSWIRNERGATVAEYGLVLALIALVAVTVLSGLGTKIKDKIEALSNHIN